MSRKKEPEDLSQFSMADLFRLEAESQLTTLSEGLMKIESGAEIGPVLEQLMRAAHSLKGAARVVNIDPAVEIAHAMEDVFVQAQQQMERPAREKIDLLLKGVDLLQLIAFEKKPAPTPADIEAFVAACSGEPSPIAALPVSAPIALVEAEDRPARSLRIASDNLDRLVALAGETRITLKRTEKFNRDASRLRNLHQHFRGALQDLEQAFAGSPHLTQSLTNLRDKMLASESEIQGLASNLEEYSFQASLLGNRLYAEALGCRMRPFGDCGPALRRLTRDLSHSLGKDCQLEIRGENTEVDRDILEKLESVLTHLIRNALDHGIELPAARQTKKKASEGSLQVEATHIGGRLVIRLSDDGKGIDPERIRGEIVNRGLISGSAAENLTISEVMEFLFLPGFSLAEKVTELSGRGVGLDAVRVMARGLHGTARILNNAEGGTTIELSLPVSQALARCLLVQIAGIPHAIPLARIEGVFHLAEDAVDSTEGRQHCEWNGHRIGLVNAAQVLELQETESLSDPLSVLVLAEAGQRFGVIVSRFLGEQELLMQPLDDELGKIRDLAATALMDDGTPILILDDEDFLLSIRNLAGGGKLQPARMLATVPGGAPKRVLVVDDSLTVRELERKLLSTRGYAVTTAVDGMDGWNTLRESTFDLVITDVDMPRMDGIELVERIRANPKLRDLPVLIVSYKDRPEDRQRGLEAGADYYLAKSSFHSDELARMVEELIGMAVSA